MNEIKKMYIVLQVEDYQMTRKKYNKFTSNSIEITCENEW